MMAGRTTVVGEIVGTTNADLGNKDEAAAAAVTTAMVTEESWIDYVVILYKPDQQALLPGSKAEGADEPTTTTEAATMITEEKVPDTFMQILRQRRPFSKHPPLSDGYSKLLSKYVPELLELWLIDRARRNCCVDLHEDVLRQYAEKGFAEVGVDFTGGVKKIFVLPQPKQV